MLAIRPLRHKANNNNKKKEKEKRIALKPGFDDMFSSCGKKNMWKCAYVVLCSNDMVKARMVSEFSVVCLVVFA